MDDFLYIIIGIIWVVYSLYTNKQKQDKKRAMRDARSGAPQAETPPVRSLLEEILMGELRPPQPRPEAEEEHYEPEYRPTIEANSSETIVTEAESQEEIREEVSASYFETQYANRKSGDDVERVTQKHILIEEDENMHETEAEFDLKTAVIYAEILNPRYV